MTATTIHTLDTPGWATRRTDQGDGAVTYAREHEHDARWSPSLEQDVSIRVDDHGNAATVASELQVFIGNEAFAPADALALGRALVALLEGLDLDGLS